MAQYKVHHARLNRALLRDIFASDQSMYPAPLTFDRLCSWVDSSPDLSVSFLADGGGDSPVHMSLGVIIVLPILGTFWKDLLVGKIKETDIDAQVMLAKSTEEADVGLHVFHIERSEAYRSEVFGKSFTKLALEEIQGVAGKRPWKISGYSALTATPAGKAAFGKIGFEPTGYREAFVSPGSSDGGEQRPEMVCAFPGQTVVDDRLQDDTALLAKLDMVVKNAEF